LTGTSTLSVSLPKSWANRYSVKKGAELLVSEAEDGSLVVKLEGGEVQKETAEINCQEYDSAEKLRRRFLSLYLAGYSSIRIFSKQRLSLECRKTVVDEARRLIGVEATEETPNSITVQDFFSHEGLSVESTLKRTHLLTSSLFEDLLNALAKNDRLLARNLAGRDDDIDRLRFLLLRQLGLALRDAALLHDLKLDASDCVSYAVVARDVEQIADRLSRIAKYFSDTPGSKNALKTQKRIGELSREAFELYKTAMESFLKKDTGKANEALDSKQSLYLHREEFEREMAKAGSVPFEYGGILDSIMGIAELSGEIAEVAIDQE